MTSGSSVPVGTFVFSPDPAHTEIAVLANLDFVVVDTEHAPMTIADVLGHVRAAQPLGTRVMVRSPFTSLDDVARYLDMGADGIVVPHAGRDIAHTAQILDATRFAPSGGRAACSGVRAAGYSMLEFSSVVEKSNRDVLRWGLIEDPEVVDNIDEVLEQCRFDAIIPGPGDLAAALGVPGELSHPRVIESMSKVIEAARRVQGCQVGMYLIDPLRAGDALLSEADFLIFSIDYRIFGQALKLGVEQVRAERSQGRA